MNQPTSDRPMAGPDQITAPAPAILPMLPIDLLDACGSGYTAADLARLKGNIGSQNYELPANLDLSRFRSVVISCRRFTTVFSTAELVPGA